MQDAEAKASECDIELKHSGCDA